MSIPNLIFAKWMQNRSLKETACKKKLLFGRMAKAYIEHWKNNAKCKAVHTITKSKGVPTNRLYHRSPNNQNKPRDQKLSPVGAKLFMNAQFKRLSKQPVLSEFAMSHFSSNNVYAGE